MKNFVIQNRKIFVTTCVAVMLCVVTVLHFAEPQDEQIPKLNLPAVLQNARLLRHITSLRHMS